MNAHNIELRYNIAFTPPRQNDSIIMFKVCLHGVSKEELVCFNNVIFFIGTLICLTLQQVIAWASQMRHGWLKQSVRWEDSWPRHGPPTSWDWKVMWQILKSLFCLKSHLKEYWRWKEWDSWSRCFSKQEGLYSLYLGKWLYHPVAVHVNIYYPL